MNDWSTHLINVEKLLRSIEDKLLHKRHEGIKDEIYEAIDSLYDTLTWTKNNPDK
jgi:predicted glycosyltransferase